jgi:hypothetical protein
VAVHQALISDVLRGLCQTNVQIGPLFTDNRWRLVRSSAPRRSWLNVLTKNGFPCSVEDELPIRVDSVVDLIEIGQFADASRDQLLQLTWLAPSLRFCKDNDVVMVDRGPLTWAPVSLSTDRVVFDTSCLGTKTEHHDGGQ